jgi:eukaryotic-like serine/threonine-protein kinase
MEQPATVDPLIGATIGNYQIKTKVGEGGMGSVYMAEHPLIGKRVALKILHAEFSSKEDVVKRFFQEAKAVNDIQHPNIVDIVDYGVITSPHGQSTVYFIMEFLDGPSLADLIRNEAPLAPERALSVALQIADALGACHSAGVVHRDLKPDNIILIPRGRERDFVKVLDFGIAKLTGDQKVSVRTRTGLLMGTPAYMSPEQCEGSATVDHRTDVYALGILLYEMLSGQVPFTGETYGQILLQHLTQVPTPLSMTRGVIPPHVEAVVLKALEKVADARYQTMDELMKALADPVGYVERHGGLSGFMGRDAMGRPMSASISVFTPSGQRIQVPTSMISTPMVPIERPRRGQRIALIAMLGVLLGLGGAGVWWMNQQELAAAESSSEDSPGGSPEESGDTQARQVPPVIIQTGEPGAEDPGARANPEQQEPPNPDTAAARDTAAEPAPAPGTTPNVEATPAAAEEVVVRVLSSPEGAAVYFNDERKPRGKTPLELSVARGKGQARVTLRLDGFREEMRKFVPDSNKEYDLQLRRDRRSARDPRSGDRNNRNTTRPPDQQNQTGDPQRTNRNHGIEDDVGLEEPPPID